MLDPAMVRQVADMVGRGYGRYRIAEVLGAKESVARRYITEAVRLGAEKNRHHKEHMEADAAEVSSLKAQVASLTKQVAILEKQVETERKRVLGKLPKPSARELDGHVRVIIPDSHGCHIDHDAAAAMLSDLRGLNPAEVVMLGDHVDCGGFLAQHHQLMRPQSLLYSYEQDIAATAVFLDQIQQAAPGAKVHYLEGNHEARVTMWCIRQGVGNKTDTDMLIRRLAPRYLLGLKERGIDYYGRHERFDGIAVAGAIRLGQCYFLHGFSHAKEAATSHLRQFGANVVFGHTHRMQQASTSFAHDGSPYTAWSVGCLARLDRDYQFHAPHEWRHGYGVQFVAKSGVFQHVTVPIIGGQSLLHPLLARVG